MVPVVAVIEVYADICCPFTHVGLHAIAKRRREVGRNDVALRVRAWPLELVNGTPLDAMTTAKHIDALRAQVAPDLFTQFDHSHFPHTSLPALAVAAAAYRQGDGIGEAVSFALRDALFEGGRDISRPLVLVEIANAHGVGDIGPEDDEAVQAQWREGRSRGVKGSPHFFCENVDAFCPSLDISRDRAGEIRLRRDAKALDLFLTECFKG